MSQPVLAIDLLDLFLSQKIDHYKAWCPLVNCEGINLEF